MLTQTELKQIRQGINAKTKILQNLIPPTVSYVTEGNILIIGPEDLARLAADKLAGLAGRVILANEPVTSQDETHLATVMDAAADVESYYNKLVGIKGFLGQFQVIVEHNDTQAELSIVALRKAHFDLILDMSLEPQIQLEMLPPGYFHVGQDKEKLADALATLPDMIGEFGKPRYVKVNADICAHYRNENNGCNRCLNFCPADAIKSIDQIIEIDPYLCHGAGSCTNACPTEAISYDLPTPQALHSYLQKLIGQFREQAQVAPVILIHDESKAVNLINDDLPGEILPISLEEITVAGIDHWMTALAFGARQVLLLQTDLTSPTLTQMLTGELALANEILDEMGQPQRIQLINEAQLEDLTPLLDVSRDWSLVMPITEVTGNKRARLFAAIDHLNTQAGNVETVLVKSNIPYGDITVDVDSCTLCLSCVATCPTQALRDGQEEPILSFVEQDCIQCGLCEMACPEKVISLQPQINFNQEKRQEKRVIKEEPPFECVSCGAPFATQSMIHKMLDMVGSHDAFSGNIERLKMCADCRVKDMVGDLVNDPEQQMR